MNKFCNQCGTPRGASVKFCGNCGFPVPGIAEPRDPEQVNPAQGNAERANGGANPADRKVTPPRAHFTDGHDPEPKTGTAQNPPAPPSGSIPPIQDSSRSTKPPQDQKLPPIDGSASSPPPQPPKPDPKERNKGTMSEPIIDDRGVSCSSCGNRRMLVGDTICNACGATFQTPIKVRQPNLQKVPRSKVSAPQFLLWGFVSICMGVFIWVMIGAGFQGHLGLPDGLKNLTGSRSSLSGTFQREDVGCSMTFSDNGTVEGEADCWGATGSNGIGKATYTISGKTVAVKKEDGNFIALTIDSNDTLIDTSGVRMNRQGSASFNQNYRRQEQNIQINQQNDLIQAQKEANEIAKWDAEERSKQADCLSRGGRWSAYGGGPMSPHGNCF